MLAHLPGLIYISFIVAMADGCRAEDCHTDRDCPFHSLCIASQCLPSNGADNYLEDSDAERVTLPCPAPSVGQLKLNEILADPGASDPNQDGFSDSSADEFVEILNTSDRDLNLTGVSLRVGSHTKHTFEGSCLEAGQAMVIFSGGMPGQAPSGSRSITSSKRLTLSNQGATVSLYDITGERLDSHRYTRTTDKGTSITRSPDGSGSWGSHADDSRDTLMSPGQCMNGGYFPECDAPEITVHDDFRLDKLYDCLPVSAGELRLNEIMPDPGLSDTNGDGLLYAPHDEFIELVLVANGNRKTADTKIFVNGEERYKLPELCIKPGTAIVIFGGGQPQMTVHPGQVILASETPLRLANSGGQVSLHLASIIDTDVVWGNEGGKDQSITRFPDISGPWVLHSSISPFNASPGWCTNGAELLANGCDASL